MRAALLVYVRVFFRTYLGICVFACSCDRKCVCASLKCFLSVKMF